MPNLSFQEKSYRIHEKMHAEEVPDVLMYPGQWLERNTVDLWRHLRMFKMLDPLLESFPGSSWIAIGDGRYAVDTAYIEKKGSRCLPVDIDDSLLKILKEKGQIREYSKENAEHLSFPDNAFDFAVCKEAYHHFPRPFIALYEMLRVAGKAVVLIEPRDWIPSPGTRSFLRRVKNIFRRINGRPVPHTDSGNYEEIGNYVFTISEREIQKVALGLNYPAVAFHFFHDAYIPGVEEELMNARKRPYFKRIRRMLLKNRIQVWLGLNKTNQIVAIIFKQMPDSLLIDKLRLAGYRVDLLPANPYVERTGV